MSDELLEALEKIFAVDSELYQQRGFQRRIGFGKRPALINIDLANAWTRPVSYTHLRAHETREHLGIPHVR